LQHRQGSRIAGMLFSTDGDGELFVDDVADDDVVGVGVFQLHDFDAVRSDEVNEHAPRLKAEWQSAKQLSAELLLIE
jgi:hypothetical protein